MTDKISIFIKTNKMAEQSITRSLAVKEFTEQSLNKTLPNTPRTMTLEEVKFLIKMNCEELQELLQTVLPENADTKEALLEIVQSSKKPLKKTFKDDVDIIAEQIDAFVDIDYYNNNAACKVGANPDDLFNEVHKANMGKRFPDGTFHKNSEGKIIKPENWKEPDLRSVVQRWKTSGTWN
jgi:predicted HAD superfamily Cof-like phosphohydrolase